MTRHKPVLVRITNNLGIGGVQRRLRDLLPRLAEHFTVYAITYKDRGIFFEELQDLGIHTHFLPRRPPASTVRLARFLSQLRPSIVHTHSYGGNTLGIPAARLAGVPVRIGHVHLAHLHWYAPTPWRRWVQARKEALIHRLWTHRVCCVSAEARAHFLAGTGLSPAKVVVLENGIHRPSPTEIPNQRAARDQLGLPGDAIVLGMACRLASSKDLDLGLKILAASPTSIHLAIAGPGDPEPWHRLAHRLGISHRVHFLGPLTVMHTFYAAVDLLLFPSPPGAEGMPGTVLEALGAGLAVLAQESAPLQEIQPVAPRLCFLRPDQPMEEQIRAALTTQAGSMQAFWDRFSLDAMVDRTLRLYDDLLRQEKLR